MGFFRHILNVSCQAELTGRRKDDYLGLRLKGKKRSSVFRGLEQISSAECTHVGYWQSGIQTKTAASPLALPSTKPIFSYHKHRG